MSMNAPLQHPPVVIRPFRSGDEPALHAVFHSAVHGIAAARYRPEQLEAWAPTDYDTEQWAERIRRNQPFVAEIDGQPAGYADLQADGHIDHFFVSAAHARRGVGQHLMNHILGLATQRGLSRTQAHVSLSAEPFFARNGFAVMERQTVMVRGVPLDNALMVRMQF
ncbi:GNAT family N-acetyltransferase [Ralstonia insidiosa]|uniref:Acetyltransferase n=2 Tax=Ralstonia insidiosa TaxID=190721 RepID=A0A192A5M1_9RALS|nr:acetyltransferase [Ralstonia insidiosa]KAB0469657.1 GNAT family N-acetyltransferase [Ralstonia insidiosa]MBY4910360.1 GNAT family N-acetyltransferase [Ralstonia insidiosa]